MAKTAIPTLKKPEVKYRGKTSSKEYNQMTEDLYLDLTNLFRKTNENSIRAEDTIKHLLLENSHLRNKVNSLDNKLTNIEELLLKNQEDSNRYTQVALIDNMEPDPDATEGYGALLDINHMIATLPTSGPGISKTHIWDSFKEEAVIPDELKISFDKDINYFPDASETNPHNAFDGDDTTTWSREIRYDSSDPVDYIETEMTVELPENIINNRNFNTIIVHPFPTNGIDIVKIEYSKSAGWDIIPGWPTDNNGQPIVISKSGPLKFCFEDISAKKVRIKLRQSSPQISNNKKVFTLGLKQFDILYSNYTVERASLMIPFQLLTPPNIDSGIFDINNIEAVLENENALSIGSTDESLNPYHPCTYEIYLEDEWGELEYLDNKTPINNITSTGNITTIWIKVTLHADKNLESTPALSALKIEYEAI